jgi:hypothetical protein
MPTFPVFVMMKCVVVALAVDEATTKSGCPVFPSFASPWTDRRAYAVVVPRPKLSFNAVRYVVAPPSVKRELPVDTVAQESPPAPFVVRRWSAVPSALGKRYSIPRNVVDAATDRVFPTTRFDVDAVPVTERIDVEALVNVESPETKSVPFAVMEFETMRFVVDAVSATCRDVVVAFVAESLVN